MPGTAGLTVASSVSGAQRVAAAVLAALALSAALYLGLHHPLSPAGAMAGIWFVTVCSAWRTPVWLFGLPALLPVLNFFPWTGWWLIDESDLFVLAVLAGGYARWGLSGPDDRSSRPGRAQVWVLVVLAGCVAQAAWRGWWGAPPLPAHAGWVDAFWQGMYADQVSAWNSVRVAKAFVWMLLLMPLIRRSFRADRDAAGLAFVRGMVAGLVVVGVLLLRERYTQVGLLDFVSGYRTSAAFWEMHVGGGALDAWLAMAAPLSLWAVWTAPSRIRWWGALGLLWLTVYGLLTTYSRGVMLAFVVTVLAWTMTAHRLHVPHDGKGPGRHRVLLATLIALLVQGSLVLGGGAILGHRFEASARDMLGRWAHWKQGLGLAVKADDALWLGWWGQGMGRFTARYRWLGPDSELPGRAVWARAADGRGSVWLVGPDSRTELAMQYALTQQVRLRQADGYRVRIKMAGAGGDEVLASVCTRHLLHTLYCQWQSIRVEGADTSDRRWQLVDLQGAPMPVQSDARTGSGDLSAVFSLQVLRARQVTQVQSVELLDSSGRQLLRNGDFSSRLVAWMPAAEDYFLPWHIDNLYLDLFLEVGGLGLLLFAGLTLSAFSRLRLGLAQRDTLAWAYGSSLLGLLVVGAVISITEAPRVMLLALMVLWMPFGLWTKR